MPDRTAGPSPAVFVTPGTLATMVPPRSSAYFFDVDGTLLDIRPRPGDVVADEQLRRLLTRLATAARGALALVSGRMIVDLDRIFSPLIFPAAGLHGAEIRFSDGTQTSVGQEVMDHARPSVGRFVSSHAGLLLEDKGATLAVHFRQRPDLEAAVMAFMAEVGAARGLSLQAGKMVAELKPIGFDKGRAIATLMERVPFAGRNPVFVGDDLTDESGFGVVNRADGVSIRIGPLDVASDARFRLADPAALRTVLEAIATQD